jgi:hypothetical protein
MMRSRSLRRLIPLALVVLLLPSCGDSADDSSDTTSAPATTTTTAATTTSEVTSTTEATTTTIRVTADTLLLTFDGGSCTYEGLTELTPGPVELVFLNQSEEPAAVNMVSIDEGYTIQDVIADFDTEPATGHHPSWTRELGTWQSTAPGESHRWEGDLEAGLYAMACARLMPLGVWFGTGLTVEQ